MLKKSLLAAVFLGFFNISGIGWAIPCFEAIFLDGGASFANLVASYKSCINLEETQIVEDNGPLETLGIPGHKGEPGIGFASFDHRGSPTLNFSENSFTGGSTSSTDLWIGGTRGVDFAFGFGPLDVFPYRRLRDDPNQGDRNSIQFSKGGIDAAGAIAPATPAFIVSEPTILLLLGSGLLVLARYARRKLKKV